MPMRSQAQRRYLWAKHPSVARTFEDHTAKGAKLPDRVSAEKKAALAAYLKTAVVAGPGPSVVPGVPGPTQVQPGTSAPGNAPAPGQGSPSQGGPPAGSTPGAADAQQGMPAPQGPTAPPQGAAGPPGAPPGPPQPQPMNAADAIAMQRIAQMKPGAKPVVKPDLPAQPPGPVALSKSASLILISHVLKKHL